MTIFRPEMKKVIALIVALVYLTTSSGMVMNVQYCFGKVSSVQVNGFGVEDGCCCKSEEKTSGCCSHDVLMVKLQDTHEAAFALFSIKNIVELNSLPLSFLNATPPQPLHKELVQVSDSSPPITPDAIYIKNCVFRI